jgi:Skp family chaperone for outer membrane proteins
MKRSRTMVGAGLVAFGLVMGVGMVMPLQAKQAVRAPVPGGIATINLEKVFNSMTERGDKARDLDEFAKRTAEELKKQRDDAQARAQAVRAMPEGAEREAEIGKVNEMGALAELRERLAQNAFNDRTAGMFKSLYARISTAAESMAKARGYTLVLVSDVGVQIPAGANAQEVQRVLSLKRFVYGGPEHDITDDLIAQLNNEYAVNKK